MVEHPRALLPWMPCSKTVAAEVENAVHWREQHRVKQEVIHSAAFPCGGRHTIFSFVLVSQCCMLRSYV